MDKKDNFIAKRGATLLLKVTLFIIGVIALLLCIFALPSIYKGGSAEFPYASRAILAMVVGLYITAVPFFIALWQTFKLLQYIDQNKTFSDSSVRALRNIKYCAVVIGIILMGGLPLLLPIAEGDDAPGLMVIGALFACMPFVVIIFAEVLERLLQNAIDIKSENELTV